MTKTALLAPGSTNGAAAGAIGSSSSSPGYTPSTLAGAALDFVRVVGLGRLVGVLIG